MFMEASQAGHLLYSLFLLLLGVGCIAAGAVHYLFNAEHIGTIIAVIMHELPVRLSAISTPWLALLANDCSDIGPQIHSILFQVVPAIGYFGTAILLCVSWTVRFVILGACWTWWISDTFRYNVTKVMAWMSAELRPPEELFPSSAREAANSIDLGHLRALDQYRYEKLDKDEIRLLRLHAGDAPWIECELVACRLGQLPWFEAISYTWGTSNMLDTILVRARSSPGSEPDVPRQIPVTANAHAVLRNRRSMRHSRLLWIDSICINQQDDVEKTHQVGLMRTIYKRAGRVVVWLGAEDGGEIDAPEARRAKHMLYEVAFLGHFYKHEVVHERLHRRYAHHWVGEPMRSHWSALIRLCTNPYWGRMWIVQEIALACSVEIVYGPEYISWPLLAFVMGIFRQSEGMYLSQLLVSKRPAGSIHPGVPMSVVMVPMIRRIDNRGSNLPTNFIDLLCQLQVQQAKDPRDKVFGFLGLLPEDELHSSVMADYGKSVTEVYRDVARYILASQGIDRVLSRGGVGFPRSHCVDCLPSWLPDWDMPALNSLNLYQTTSSRPYACGGAGPVYFGAAGRHSRPLSVSAAGFIADTVKWMGGLRDLKKGNSTPNETFADLTDAMSWFREARTLAQKHASTPYPCRDGPLSAEEALWRTLILDCIGGVRPAPLAYGVHYRILVDFVFPTTEDLLRRPWSEQENVAEMRTLWTGPETEPLLNRARKYAFAWFTCTRQRRLGVTASGYLALLPEYTQVGDFLCVLTGYPMPVVLRQVSSTEAADKADKLGYLFVGETYVHGWMDGEAFDRGHPIIDLEII